MKKRLLALALCLVMMTSLLPLTAAAEETRVFKSVALKGEVKENIFGSGYYVPISERTFSYNDKTITHTGEFFTDTITTDPEGNNQLNTPPVEGETYYIEYRWDTGYEKFNLVWDDPFIGNLEIPGYKTELIEKNNRPDSNNCPVLYFTFSLTKEHEHTWQFTQTENTLTAECQKQDTPQ